MVKKAAIKRSNERIEPTLVPFTCGKCGKRWKQIREKGKIIACPDCKNVSIIGCPIEYAKNI